MLQLLESLVYIGQSVHWSKCTLVKVYIGPSVKVYSDFGAESMIKTPPKVLVNACVDVFEIARRIYRQNALMNSSTYKELTKTA